MIQLFLQRLEKTFTYRYELRLKKKRFQYHIYGSSFTNRVVSKYGIVYLISFYLLTKLTCLDVD